MFPAQTYIQRRRRLRDQVGSGVLLILGNDESPMNYADNPFHFRQDSTFLYFFGLSTHGLAAVIDVDEGREVLFGNDLTVEDIVWMGTQPTLAEKSRDIGIEEVQPSAKLKECLTAARAKSRKIHILPPYRAEHRIKLWDLLEIPPDRAEEAASVEFITAVVDQRNTKTAEEIEELDWAASISADMHLAAMQMARPGLTEAEIAADVHQVALAAGGQLAFPIIATIHGETLHNHFHGNVLKGGDMFLLDAGAETAMGYAGDLSSTMPVDERFNPRQKEIYQVALDAHEAAVAALKPGIPFRDVHLLACRTVAQGLKDLGGRSRRRPRPLFPLRHRAHDGPRCARHGEPGGKIRWVRRGREEYAVRPQVPAPGAGAGAGIRADRGTRHLLHSRAHRPMEIREQVCTVHRIRQASPRP
jgi:Xaa-Pro aminopeptidase